MINRYEKKNRLTIANRYIWIDRYMQIYSCKGWILT